MQQRAAEMRKHPSWLEEKMITLLSKLGVYFKFQKVIGDYILDFYLPEVCLNIETNGVTYHKDRKPKDKIRDKFLRKKGIRILRFQIWQLDKRPDWIAERILHFFPKPKDYLTEEFKHVA